MGAIQVTEPLEDRMFLVSKPEWTKQSATHAAFCEYQIADNFQPLRKEGWLIEVDRYGSGWALYLVRERAEWD